jgi:16S rRNA (guanine(966)-N(2))-methyltransferase RsmD
VEGRAVRPTSDRLRETLFNVLAPSIEGDRFLDVCAGSGAVGIEALSRGASSATFIERSRKACSIIAQNLESLGIQDQADILNREAPNALRRLADAGDKFDIAFVDPPYASGVYSEIMLLLAESGLLDENGIVIVEHRAKLPPESEFGPLRIYRELKQGESALAFYARV